MICSRVKGLFGRGNKSGLCGDEKMLPVIFSWLMYCGLVY